MGSLRLVGSLKLQVSSENIGLFCRAFLQKRPIILRSLLIVATPHEEICSLAPHSGYLLKFVGLKAHVDTVCHVTTRRVKCDGQINDEAWHVWKRHVTNKWGGMLRMNEAACHVWKKHVPYDWGDLRARTPIIGDWIAVLLKQLDSSHTWMRCVVYQGGVLHINENK